jgi:hypothetical protein
MLIKRRGEHSYTIFKRAFVVGFIRIRRSRERQHFVERKKLHRPANQLDVSGGGRVEGRRKYSKARATILDLSDHLYVRLAASLGAVDHGLYIVGSHTR